MEKFVAKRVKEMEGRYEYRGREIWRKNSTPSGYWGRWNVGAHGFSSMADAKNYIDQKIEQKEAMK